MGQLMTLLICTAELVHDAPEVVDFDHWCDVLRFTLRNKTINYFPAECADCSSVFLCEKHTPAAFVFKMTS